MTDRYAATTGDVKGILIEKAGSQYSPTAALDNTLLNQMKEIDEQIEKWQDKMSNKVDYYTNKFTQLEVLIQQMNFPELHTFRFNGRLLSRIGEKDSNTYGYERIPTLPGGLVKHHDPGRAPAPAL